MKFDVVCIGAAVIDITATPIGQSIKWDEKQRIRSIRIGTGGDAANQSIHLADLGLRTALAANVGMDANADVLTGKLAARGVDTSMILHTEQAETGTAIVLVDEAGERHIFSAGGAHSTISAETCRNLFEHEFKALSLASLFSIPQLEDDGLTEILKKCREKGIPVFADLANDKRKLGLKGLQGFLPYIDWFMPSLYDAQRLTGRESPEENAEELLACGVKGVIIKCGADGAYYRTKDLAGHQRAVRTDTVDTTGAGDCMSALFISRILAGDTVEDAVSYACRGASLSTKFMGASETVITDEMIRAYGQDT